MASLPTGALARTLLAPSIALSVSLAAAVGCTTTDSNVTATNGAPSATSGSGTSGGTGSTTTKAGSSPGTKRSTTSTADPTETTTGDSTDTTTDTSTLPKACDLLTEADATKAFGEPAVAGDQRQDECWWSTANDLKTVNLIRRTGDIEEWRRGYQNDKWEKVDRGDEGYQGKVLDSIVFRLGDTTYEINVVYSTKGDPERVVQDLADTVQSRL